MFDIKTRDSSSAFRVYNPDSVENTRTVVDTPREPKPTPQQKQTPVYFIYDMAAAYSKTVDTDLDDLKQWRRDMDRYEVISDLKKWRKELDEKICYKRKVDLSNMEAESDTESEPAPRRRYI